MAEIVLDYSGMKTPTIYEKIIHPRLSEKLKLDDTGGLEQEKQDADFLSEQFNEIKNIIVNGIMPVSSGESGLEALFTPDIIQRL